MVRKPVVVDKGQAVQALPYPITPTSPGGPSSEALVSPHGMNAEVPRAESRRGNDGLDVQNHNGSASTFDGITNELPPTLRVGSGILPPQTGSASTTPRSSWESERPDSISTIFLPSPEERGKPPAISGSLESTNPFRRKHIGVGSGNGKASEESSHDAGSSSDVWAGEQRQHVLDVGQTTLRELK